MKIQWAFIEALTTSIFFFWKIFKKYINEIFELTIRDIYGLKFYETKIEYESLLMENPYLILDFDSFYDFLNNSINEKRKSGPIENTGLYEF